MKNPREKLDALKQELDELSNASLFEIIPFEHGVHGRHDELRKQIEECEIAIANEKNDIEEQ